jgi:hypothetical protein
MPRRLHFGGHQVDVLETFDQWHGPDYRYIKARATDGGLYILPFDEPQAECELTMFKSARLARFSARYHDRRVSSLGLHVNLTFLKTLESSSS